LIRGDVSQDQHVDTNDITQLIALLANPNGYLTSHPGFDNADVLDVADVNKDGSVTNADIQALINQLLGGGGSQRPVPEPSSCLLLGLVGIGCLPHCYKRLRGQARSRSESAS